MAIFRDITAWDLWAAYWEYKNHAWIWCELTRERKRRHQARIDYQKTRRRRIEAGNGPPIKTRARWYSQRYETAKRIVRDRMRKRTGWTPDLKHPQNR